MWVVQLGIRGAAKLCPDPAAMIAYRLFLVVRLGDVCDVTAWPEFRRRESGPATTSTTRRLRATCSADVGRTKPARVRRRRVNPDNRRNRIVEG